MKILITGGLGFIGINAVKEFCKYYEVHIIDNLSRKGNLHNYQYVSHIDNVYLHVKDIRNFHDLSSCFEKIKPDVILHLAGQVAVTYSVENPREDFEINILGTFNLLECVRNYTPNSVFIYSSTNKVYGNYETGIIELEKRYSYDKLEGVDESIPIDFHSPYGCSKGSADQYVRDYHRIYGLKTVVLRQSCIYGPNQFGIEDQGWLAWFTIASTFNKKFYIYGDGKQVRDVLFIDDLIDLYKKIINNIDMCEGQIFNVGGGSENSLSLLELVDILNVKLGGGISYTHKEWRPGDQKIYISNTKKLNDLLGWRPKIDTSDGINKLFRWVQSNKKIFTELKLI